MVLTSEEVYELCQDFKDLVKSGDFVNLLPVDLKLLSIRDCVLFYRDTIEQGVKINERVTGVHEDRITVFISRFKEGKLKSTTQTEYPLSDLSNFRYLLAPNKVVMSEIGKFYSKY